MSVNRSNTDRFARDYADVWQWMITSAPTFDFAASLRANVERWGGLTANQMVAARKCMSRSKAAPSAPPRGARVNVEAVQRAFDNASEAGLKRPKLRFATFSCSMAPAAGKNPGAIYVKAGDLYLGKVTNGEFHSARECTPTTERDVVQVLQDPMQAAIAYGRRTGACSCCGRELSDPVSVERGIGPICANKYGW